MLAILILAEGLTAFRAPGFAIAMAQLVRPAGMSMETWTAIIAAFPPVLAPGCRFGGRVAAFGPRQGTMCHSPPHARAATLADDRAPVDRLSAARAVDDEGGGRR